MAVPPPLPSEPKPKLAWYEQAWIGWPFILVFVGGLIGGACGGAAWAANQQVFRKVSNPLLRYVYTGIISVLALVLYVVVAGVLVAYLPSRQ